MKNLHTEVLLKLVNIGDMRVLSDTEDMSAYLTDWRGRYRGNAVAVVFPKEISQVSETVRLCHEQGIAVVPQGGNTGLTGGAVGLGDRASIIVNMSRMDQIREVDVVNNSLTAEAGCILSNLREAAEEKGRQFPLLLGSAGSCEVGGLISTNAGGTGVLRYGNMRDLVLGLEVVLPDGRVWNGLKTLRKDNSGYDLKQIFIGAEGTLGIVTAATLKLVPRIRRSGTAMVSLPDVRAAVQLLSLFHERVGNCVESFELMSRGQLEVVLQHPANRQCPMPLEAPWFVMIELGDSKSDFDSEQYLELVLGEAMEKEWVLDAVIANNDAKAQRIWELRHTVSESNIHAGFSVANDTSVPISRLPEFIDTVTQRLEEHIPACRVVHCGHIGDGNIHVVVILDRKFYATEFTRERAAAEANLLVHQVSIDLEGSISAEHGIGMMHVEELERFKPAIDIEMMRAIKRAFDPGNVMNPGKVIRIV